MTALNVTSNYELGPILFTHRITNEATGQEASLGYGSDLSDSQRLCFDSTELKKCPECKYRTVEVKTRRLREPTSITSEEARVTETCLHCSHRREYTAKLPPPLAAHDDNDRSAHSTSSLSISFGGRSSSGSGSSFGSSSSSSRSRSFGGGRSSGGGASGSW